MKGDDCNLRLLKILAENQTSVGPLGLRMKWLKKHFPSLIIDQQIGVDLELALYNQLVQLKPYQLNLLTVVVIMKIINCKSLVFLNEYNQIYSLYHHGKLSVLETAFQELDESNLATLTMLSPC